MLSNISESVTFPTHNIYEEIVVLEKNDLFKIMRCEARRETIACEIEVYSRNDRLRYMQHKGCFQPFKIFRVLE